MGGTIEEPFTEKEQKALKNARLGKITTEFHAVIPQKVWAEPAPITTSVSTNS